MEPKSSKFWTWRSTEHSRTAGQVSILAIEETFICVAIYWFAIVRFGVTWHHWIILIATPLVLLRSDQSVALSQRWFRSYIKQGRVPTKSLAGAVSASVSCIVSFLASWGLSSSRYVEIAGRPFPDLPAVVLLAALLGVSVTIAATRVSASAVAVPIAVAAAVWGALLEKELLSALWLAFGLFVTVFSVAKILGRDSVEANGGAATREGLKVASGMSAAIEILMTLPLFVSVGFGILIRAALIRFLSNMRFILPGLTQFASNWRFSTIISDVFHPPELIEDEPEFIYGQTYSLTRRNWKGERLTLYYYIMGLAFIPIFYIPTLVWRWSIKSTAWFYLPLLWVRRGWRRLEGEELVVWAKSYSSKAINWTWMVLGGLSLTALAVTLFSVQKWFALKESLDQAGAPTTILGFLSALDWSELPKQPWLWFYIPSYALTILIFFALDSIAKDIRHGGAEPDSRAPNMRRWMWAANVRTVLTNIGLAIALWYFLAAVNAWGQIDAFFSW